MVNQIPDSVTFLASTFSLCFLLEQIPELPENVIILNKVFNHCRSIKEAPEIPYGVTDMEWAFNTGNLEIDANPESYSDCFKNASWSNFKAKLTLWRTSSLLEELAATKSSNSVIEIA